jgi:hypothetical protein
MGIGDAIFEAMTQMVDDVLEYEHGDDDPNWFS